MSTITKPKTLTNGTVAQATDVESNFSTIYNDYNGNIDNTNLAAAAAIADTKLAQITTYNKVTGAALGSLASISSAAGVIPSANIPLLSGLSTASVGAICYAAANTAITALATGVSGTFLMSSNTTGIPVFSRPTARIVGIDKGTVTGVGDGTPKAVSFNFTFTSAPVVVATQGEYPSHNDSVFHVDSITTAGFNITCFHNAGASSFYWIAVGTAA